MRTRRRDGQPLTSEKLTAIPGRRFPGLSID